MNNIKKVGFTGSSGMVGRHLNARLEADSIDYVALNREQWDLSEWKPESELDDMLGGVDAIIHLGAAVPSACKTKTIQDLFDSNVRCCVEIAQWALSRKVPVAYLSSATVYKSPHSLDICESDETTTDNFGGFYGFTKYLAEQVFRHFNHSGLQSVILRPTSIYGLGMSFDQLVARFLNKAENNEVLTVQPPSTNSVNFIHASDVADAILRSLKQEAWGTYNIAGEQCSIEQLAKHCIRIVGDGQLELIVDGNDTLQAPFTRFDLNYEKAQRDFNYAPNISLETGLRLMRQGKYLQ